MFSTPLRRTRPLRPDLLGSFGLAEPTLVSRSPAPQPGVLGRRSGQQSEVHEDPRDHQRRQYGGDDLELATAVQAAP